MKIKFPLFALLCVWALSFAKTSYGQLLPAYTFSQHNTTYTYLGDSTLLGSGIPLADQTYPISLPFTFNFDGVDYTQVYASVNGYLSLGSTDPGSGFWKIAAAETGTRYISGFDANLRGSTTNNSSVSYKISGTAPNRKLIVQWGNMAITGFNVMNANFQVHLSESSNQVEIVYGNCTVGGWGEVFSIQVGLRGLSNSVFMNRNGYNWSTTTEGNNSAASIYYQSNNNPPSGLTFRYTAPPYCAAPAQPAAINFTPGLNNINISLTQGTPAANKYLIVRTPGNNALNTTPTNGVTYAAGATLGNGTVVYAGSGSSYNNTGLPQSTNYTYTVFGFNDVNCIFPPKYSTSSISDATGTLGPRTYTWNPVSGNASFTSPSNWTPNRHLPNNRDTLIFNNGGTTTATGVTGPNIGALLIKNNTTINLSSSTTTSLTMLDTGYIEQGSKLNLTGTNALTFGISGMQKYFRVDGELIISGNSVLNTNDGYVSVFGIVRVEGSGSVNNGGKIGFVNNSTYMHNRNGGSVPNANYMDNSTVIINGITNTAPTIPTVGNLIWDCLNQSADINLANPPGAVFGNFTINNTNNYTIRLGNGGSTIFTHVWKDFIQNGGKFLVTGNASKLRVIGSAFFNAGTFDLLSGNASVATFILEGNLNQQPGHTITSGATGKAGIEFSGHTIQNIVIGGTISNASINYSLKNPAGAVLTGIIPIQSGASNSIMAGKWDGTGKFNYNAINSTLIYNSSLSLTPTDVEWPAVDGPNNLTVNMTGSSPLNQLVMHGTRTIPGNVSMEYGVFILNQYDLILSGDYVQLSNYSMYNNANSCVVADSTGFLYHKLTLVNDASGPKFKTATREGLNIVFTPISIDYANNNESRLIGVRVKNQKHSSEPNANHHLKRYWTFKDLGNTPFDYRLVSYAVTNDVVGTNHFSLNRWNGNAWSELPSHSEVPAGNLGILCPVSSRMTQYRSTANEPLNNVDIVPRGAVHNTYYWTGAIDTNYQNPLNWQPNRNLVNPNDKLVFNSGNNHIVGNVPVETISGLLITNNTKVALHSSVVFNNDNPSYIINADTNTATHELQIDFGSKLMLDGTPKPIKIGFAQPGSKLLVDGTLELYNLTNLNSDYTNNRIDFKNSTALFSETALLRFSGTSGYKNFATDSNVTMNGVFEHDFASGYGLIPDCKWGESSLVKIINIVTTNGTACGQRPIKKLLYDNPNQTSTFRVSKGFGTIQDSLIIKSTGTGTLQLFENGSQEETSTYGNYIQENGKVISVISPTSGNRNIRITKSFLQTGGTFRSEDFTTNTTTLDFAGTNGTQQVSFHNNAPLGSMTYKISNPDGIQLNGTGTFGSQFELNARGGINIATTAANPIQTNFNFVYGPNTTLTYSANGNTTARLIEFPVTSGPANLTILTPVTSTLTIPFNSTVPGTLRMNGGDINISNNDLTLGVAPTAPGTLTYVSGYINTTTGGFTRWFNNSGLPTTATTAGLFPLGYNLQNRNVNIAFSSGNALTNGGTITARHNNIAGTTTGLNIIDGSLTINERTNTNWSFTLGNGIAAASGTATLYFTAQQVVNVGNATSLAITRANSVIGSHQATSGSYPTYSLRRAFIGINLLGDEPFYIGNTASGSMDSTWYTIASGQWQDGTIWNKGVVPPASATVMISSNHTVTAPANGAVASLFINNYGKLISNANQSLTVSNSITNNGTIRLYDGTLSLGPAGGGKAPFINNDSLTVDAGTLTINGNLQNAAQSTFAQNGGDIYLDGNANGVAANSVASATPILSFQSNKIFLNGGNITIVDPQVGGSGISKTSSSAINASTNHNLILGDGSSTTTGTSFDLQTGNLRLGNVFVNGSGASSTGRTVKLGNSCYIDGDLIINQNGIFDINSKQLFASGNIQVNSGGTFLTTGRIDFIKNNTGNNPGVQTVSGTGTIQQLATGGHNFRYLNINNNVGGVVLNIGDVSIENTLSFEKGLFNIGSNNTLLSPTSILYAGSNTGWIVGKQQLTLPYNFTPTEYVFHIGDINAYTPIKVNAQVQVGGGLLASVHNTDHPEIGSAPFVPNATVNRYFTLTHVGSLYFINGSTSVNASWISQDIDPGYNATSFSPAVYKNAGWNTATIYSPGYLSMNVSGLGTHLNGDYAFGRSSIAPAFVTQPANQNICAGQNASFHVMTTGATNYQWQLNDGNGWTNIQNNATFNGNTQDTLYVYNAPISFNGYLFRCLAANADDTTISAPATFNVGQQFTPSLTIATASYQSINVCMGQMVYYTATPTNGGNNPTYQWYYNNQPVPNANHSQFMMQVQSITDQVHCVVSYNTACFNASATSNTLYLNVSTPQPPTISIQSNTGATACSGSPVTFTATATNAGATPTFQWIKNGANVGTNAATYSDNGLISTDVITCQVTSSSTCYSSNTAMSNALSVTIYNVHSPVVSIIQQGPGNICQGTTVGFMASLSDTAGSPVIQWKKNGVNVGTNSLTYSDASLNNNDAISCHVSFTPNAVNPCFAYATTSDTLHVNIVPIVHPTVTINTSAATTICAGSSLTFTATINNGGTNPLYNWKVNGQIVGTNSSSYTSATLQNSDVVSLEVSFPYGCYSNAISNGIPVTVHPVLTPSLSISTNQNNSCTGSPAVFNATAANIGSNPVYQWKKNNINVGINSTTYTDPAPANGDQVTCVLTFDGTGQCYTSTSLGSNTITMTVNNFVTPVVTINANQGNTICAGQSVNFTAGITNGGTDPVYQWKKNNTNVGNNANVYTDAALQNNDIITCDVSYSTGCYLPASSNALTMNVTPTQIPAIDITASQNNVCAGTSITFTANSTNGGANPVYQWKKNNVNVGTNSAVYTDATLLNNDVITCVLNSSIACPSQSQVTSNSINMTINNNVSPGITISTGTTNLCSNHNGVTLTANITNGGTAPVYQWKKNNINVGTNSATYTDLSIVNGDAITCELTSNATCLTATQASSNVVTFIVNNTQTSSVSASTCASEPYIFGSQTLTASGTYTETFTTSAGCDSVVTLTLTVLPTVNPTVSINANPGNNVTDGTAVTFTATPGNAGTNPVYVWKRNNVNITGATSATWTGIAGTDFANGDEISLSMTSNAACVNPATANSNKIQMTVQGVNIKPTKVPKEIDLFPNPTKDKITIKGISMPGTLTLYDITGKKLMVVKVNANEIVLIDLKGFASGVYTINFSGAQDSIQWHTQIVKD